MLSRLGRSINVHTSVIAFASSLRVSGRWVLREVLEVSTLNEVGMNEATAVFDLGVLIFRPYK
jgi:hypothetical protein